MKKTRLPHLLDQLDERHRLNSTGRRHRILYRELVSFLYSGKTHTLTEMQSHLQRQGIRIKRRTILSCLSNLQFRLAYLKTTHRLKSEKTGHSLNWTLYRK